MSARSRSFAHPAVTAILAVAAVATLIAAYVVRSPMWLDEALSVNISRLPLGDIPGALRHDGHPPLFYFLLHVWISVVGTGNGAVRALSATISIATLPLVFASGRRIIGERGALTATLVFALSPFVLRYGSEARMYSLVIAEVFAGYLAVTASLERTTFRRLAAVTVVAAALLWTHYWSFWLLGAVGLLLVGRLVTRWRAGDRPAAATTLRTGIALGCGALLFLPWVPTLLYQNAHTGTPWAPSFRPSAMVFHAILAFAGGPYPEPQLFMLVLVVLVTLGVAGRTGAGAGAGAGAVAEVGDRAGGEATADGHTIELDVRGTAAGRQLALVTGATLAVASAVGAVNGMGFSPRYAAVVFPFVVLLVALGLETFPTPLPRNIALVAFSVASAAGLVVVFGMQRSQARVVADRIEQVAASSYVVACPDQLGPSLQRELAGSAATVVAFPSLGDPSRVDWVDYQQRNARIDPTEVARRTLRAAGDRPIAVVFRDDFLTLEGKCAGFVAELGKSRPSEQLVTESEEYYEAMNLRVFRPS